MTNEEAIKIAKNYHYSTGNPIVRIPPLAAFSVIDEIITVDLRDRNRPIVTREPSNNFGPGR